MAGMMEREVCQRGVYRGFYWRVYFIAEIMRSGSFSFRDSIACHQAYFIFLSLPVLGYLMMVRLFKVCAALGCNFHQSCAFVKHFELISDDDG